MPITSANDPKWTSLKGLVGGSSSDAAYLGALKAQIVHEPLWVKNKGNDGPGGGIGVDGTAGTHGNQNE